MGDQLEDGQAGQFAMRAKQAGGASMRSERTRDQPDAAGQEHEHDDGVEKAGGAKVDFEVGQNADENNHRASQCQQPTRD